MNRKNQDAQPSVTFETVTMDSRKFLSTLNNSAQSQVHFFEERVAKLGESHGAKWKLASLNNGRLVIEDVGTGDYYTAEYARQKGGNTTISGIKRVEIKDDEKNSIFESSCRNLVDAIESGNAKDVESAFGKISAQRFRGKAVPNSGLVRTRDGVVRHISVRKDVMSEERQADLARRIVDLVSDKVSIREGKLEGNFNDKPFKLPVSELTSRRVVAKQMQRVATNAYYSPNFQQLVESVAGLICKDDLTKAVDQAGRFLKEHQEFSLLNYDETREVIGNTLATRGVFNENLINDTTDLFRKVNLSINKNDIVDSWRKTAKKADHPVMLENVKLMEESADFPKAYDEFLSTIFEAVGETTQAALLNGLKMLKDKIGDSDPETGAQVDELVAKLSSGAGADDQATWDAMDLLARVQNDLNTSDTLNDFDQMPGVPESDAPAPAPAAAASKGGEGGGTVININTSGGAPTVDGGAPAPSPAPDAGLDAGLGDDLKLDDLDIEGSDMDLGGGDEGAEEPDKEPALNLDDVQVTAPPLNEEDMAAFNRAIALASEYIDLTPNDPAPAVDNGEFDDFVLPEGLEAAPIDLDYGLPTLTEYVLKQKLTDLEKIVNDRKLKAEDVESNIDEIAGAALAGDPALSDPKRMDAAKKELIGAYAQQRAAQTKAQAGVVENQIKSPTMQLSRRGLKKAAVNALVTEGDLKWLRREEQAILGSFKGVQFVLDHATPPVLLSMDSDIEIPIPEGLVKGALYFAEVTNEETEADGFIEWLDQNIEKFRPLTEADQKSIEEAVARLVVSPDVKVEIETTGDAGAPPIPPVVSEPPVTPVPTEGDEAGDDDIDTDEDEGEDELKEALESALGAPLQENCDGEPHKEEDCCKECKKHPCECTPAE